jgi:hypothetical protein
MTETIEDGRTGTSGQTAGFRRLPSISRDEIGIFLVGFTSLGLELIQLKLLSFFLGAVSNFIAIPIALFGLALGSLFCHFVHRGDREALIRLLSVLVFPILAATLIGVFAISNGWYSEIHVSISGIAENATKVIVYSALFLPAYFVFGALLSSYFAARAERIGRLYFFDLAGAALGCAAVPVLLATTDLPAVIVSLLFVALLLLLTAQTRHKALVVSAGVVGFAVIQAAAFGGHIFRERPVPGTLTRVLLLPQHNDTVEEVFVRWNEISRVGLYRGFKKGQDEARGWMIVQDDGISNVAVTKYHGDGNQERYRDYQPEHVLPFLLDEAPRSILVMFAGLAKDMIVLDSLADGKARIIGVELNRGVVALRNHPLLREMRIGRFLKRKGIDLVVREGRDFLNHDNRTYDLIFAATDGSVHATRTGHTRKYLDTLEAMDTYLDRLAPDGTIVFMNQPIEHKLRSFRRLFEDRGLGDLGSAVFAYGQPRQDIIRSLAVRPAGFTDEELSRIREYRKPHGKRYPTLYDPRGVKHSPIRALVEGPPLETGDLVTDDRPFLFPVDWKAFSLSVDKAALGNPIFASSWIKVFTVLVFGVLSLVVLAAARLFGRKSGRIPAPWLLYFLVSGIAYMGVEIGLIARLELFLGNPLYAVAVILALFLLSNALGALLQDRHRVMRGPFQLVALTAITVGWSVLAVNLLDAHFLSLPLAAKIPAVVLAVFPVGTCLGMFYPFGVANLVGAGRREAIPMTYGVTTLASVLGSSLAMTGITNVGFQKMILLGAAGYALTALIVAVSRRFGWI